MPIDLDHVAIAAERTADLWPRYVTDLGGEWWGGGPSPGFWFGQVGYANGMRVECLEPMNVDENDFLRRFLDRNGPGPHHLTFKVPDIHEAMDSASNAGYPVVSVNLSEPSWQEAFLHPKASCGIVVQLAHAAYGAEEFEPDPPPAEMPEPRANPATFDRIEHLVPDLNEGRRLFVGVLGGSVVAELALGDGSVALDVAWPGPGRLRLIQPAKGTDAAAWMGDRPGRLRQLVFSIDDPESVPGAVDGGDAVVVPPELNHGVRLLVQRH